MNEREKNIHLWFEMWLTKQDLGIDNIFAEKVGLVGVVYLFLGVIHG